MILKSLIKCTQCNKNYNFKNNNGTHIYICSTKKNYGKSKCDSITIHESLLLDIIEKNCKLQNKDFHTSKIKLFVREIQICKDEIEIYYKDGSRSKISDSNIIFNL